MTEPRIETLVSLEASNIQEAVDEVERVLASDGRNWVVEKVDASLSLIDVSNGPPEWLPGKWRVRCTAIVMPESSFEIAGKYE